MADFEDALSPTWDERGRRPGPSRDAVRRRLDLPDRWEGVPPQRADRHARLRPRGWHLAERHVLVDGAPISRQPVRLRARTSSTTPRELLERGSGPVLLPAQAGEPPRGAALERRLRRRPGARSAIPRGTIRATVLIETILAAFEMDEILYELRDHAAGLNAGRWDYIFSIIKKFRTAPRVRAARPRAGDDGGAVHARLHASCWCRPATGAARTPSAAWRRSSRPGATRRSTSALAKVREDKERESRRRLRRHLGRPSRPGAGRERGLRPASSASGRTRRSALATRSSSAPAELLDVACRAAA